MQQLGGEAMNSRTLVSVLTVVLFSGNLFAQHSGGGGTAGGGGGGRPSGGTGGMNTSNNPQPGLNIPNTLPNPDLGPRPMFLSGKVVVDDGTPLTDAAVIQSICRGNVRNEGYTDSKGTFSVDLNSMATHAITGAADDAGVRPNGDAISGGGRNGNSARDMRDCDLQARQVRPNTAVDAEAERGVAVLAAINRLGHVEGFTISATSAMAPGKAKKLYEQGRDDEKKNKLDAAREKFSKAVEVYPKYAVAWFELGRVQMQKNDPEAAKNSFHQAIAADHTYVSPYQELAQIAVQAKRATGVAPDRERTVRRIELRPLHPIV